MSAQTPSKPGFLKLPRKSFKAWFKRDSSPSGAQPISSPSQSPPLGPVASSILSVGLNSAAASNVSVVPVTESWWSKNREEIVVSVRQVLNGTKEVLDAVPVHGVVVKAVVGGLSEVLKVFQVSDVDATML
jgi:hypothetical protein